MGAVFVVVNVYAVSVFVLARVEGCRLADQRCLDGGVRAGGSGLFVGLCAQRTNLHLAADVFEGSGHKLCARVCMARKVHGPPEVAVARYCCRDTYFRVPQRCSARAAADAERWLSGRQGPQLSPLLRSCRRQRGLSRHVLQRNWSPLGARRWKTGPSCAGVFQSLIPVARGDA